MLGGGCLQGHCKFLTDDVDGLGCLRALDKLPHWHSGRRRDVLPFILLEHRQYDLLVAQLSIQGVPQQDLIDLVRFLGQGKRTLQLFHTNVCLLLRCLHTLTHLVRVLLERGIQFRNLHLDVGKLFLELDAARALALLLLVLLDRCFFPTFEKFADSLVCVRLGLLFDALHR